MQAFISRHFYVFYTQKYIFLRLIYINNVFCVLFSSH